MEVVSRKGTKKDQYPFELRIKSKKKYASFYTRPFHSKSFNIPTMYVVFLYALASLPHILRTGASFHSTGAMYINRLAHL
jgi:hypothetical protein